MKYKMLSLTLALAAISWAQTATPTTPSTPQNGTPRGSCACCENMASADAHACCARNGAHNTGAKEMAACSTSKQGASRCAGQDAKSSTKAGKDKCSSDCDKSEPAKACCGSGEKQCAGRKMLWPKQRRESRFRLLGSNCEQPH